MTLTNFEGLVEAKIVERGYDYYKRGRIAKVEQVGEGEFNAVAFGSDDYEVYVRIDGERIVEYECDCPYDWEIPASTRLRFFIKSDTEISVTRTTNCARF